jgi:hypothetical protein
MKIIGKSKELYEKYERYLMPAAFLAGFVWDNLTLRRIDLLYENIVFLIYIFVAGAGIILVNVSPKYIRLVPLFMQFAFGGLFSAFVVFYFRSASFTASWPFLVLLLFFLIGNEIFKKQYLRLVFQLSVFFVVLFSYSIFALPVFIGKMGDGVFLLSGVVSLFVMGLLILALNLSIPGKIYHVRRALFSSVAGIYVLLNIFYFTNIIPPIPLSLKDIGIYHSVDKISAGQYTAASEHVPWYSVKERISPVFHWVPGTSVYAFSAVFAPTKINTTIFHVWYYFDESRGEWMESSRLGFSIAGGRGGGYRGYTVKSGVFPGKWRVDVTTGRGQILGRLNFGVVKADTLPELEISTI